MGVVYLCRDLRLDMDVAIKFRGVADQHATLWLKREFRTVASLHHPNLVELYELVVHERSCYFTMEYLSGLDPRRWVAATPHDAAAAIRATGPAPATPTMRSLHEAHTEASMAPHVEVPSPFARAAPLVDHGRIGTLLAQLAEGLAFLHAAGVIHRDVKPSNAIVVDGVVKLLDFGLALEQRRIEDHIAREHRAVGTTAYLAPEYLEKLQVSPAMDVYALGVLAFELVTGAPPFNGTLHLLSRMRPQIVVPRASTLNPTVSPDLDALIARMLASDPELRPSATEVAAELTGTLSQPRRVRRTPRFFGRTHELARIATEIAEPAARARFVLVTGPSGAGKTALIDEALGRARDRDTLIWRGRCHERERVPYRALDSIIDDIATALAEDPRHAGEIEHAEALARVFPVIAPLIDPIHVGEPAAIDLRVAHERALLAMTQLFRRFLRTPRGVIVIDDLQWADDDSLELLALLVERVDRPLTIIASYTTEAELPAGPLALLERIGKPACTIALPALALDDVAQLIAVIAPAAPSTHIATAARLAAGNPYLAELLGCELAETTVTNLEDAEARRLDRLQPFERAVAELAAVAGGTATFEQLRALAELPSGRLRSVLRGLEDARIVRATPSATGEPVYVFYHRRLREAAHAAMAPAVWRGHHERFASWYERANGDPGQLAYHWQQAGLPARAAPWAIAAADAARAQLAWGIAADWYDRALELGDADSISARAGRAEMRFLGGRLAAAAEDFLVLASADRDGDRWRVRAGEAYLKLGEIERGLEVLDGVLERRGQRRARGRAGSVIRAAVVAARWLAPVRVRTKPVDEVLAAAYRVIGSFLSTPYPIEALEYVLRGVALAERTGDRAVHSQGLAMLGVYLATGSMGRFGDRALAHARRLAIHGDAPYPLMVMAGAEGIIATVRGDWTGMRSAHAEAHRVCTRLGLERTWEASFLRSFQALGENYAGDPIRALAILHERAADDLFSRVIFDSVRGRALVLAGELDEAHRLARELTRTRAAHRGIASVYRQVFEGELALAEHAWDRARAIGIALGAEVRREWLGTLPAVSAMVDVVVATAELGRPGRTAAGEARATARRLFRKSGASFYAATALRLWAQAEGRLGHHGTSRSLLRRAAEVAGVRGGLLDRLAIAAMSADRSPALDPGVLVAAVTWCTGGAVTDRAWRQ